MSKEYVSPDMKKFYLSKMTHAFKTGDIDSARQMLALGQVSRQDFRKAMADSEKPKLEKLKKFFHKIKAPIV